MSKTKKSAAVFFAAIFFLLAVAVFPVSAVSDTGGKTLIAAGVPFGVRLHTDGVIVVGFTKVSCVEGAVCPAREAGLCKGDVITEICGKRIKSAKELCEPVESTGGELTVKIKRGGEEKIFTVRAKAAQDGKYKIGVFVRDDAAGIGTVTFIDPETGAFGGLGHGIYDIESETLIPMSKGIVNSVNIKSVRPGKVGIPGELKGCLEAKKIGKLTQNTEYGVFGYFTQKALSKEGALPIARKTQVKPGKAQMICTTDDVRDTYEVEITEIHNDRPAKNYVIKITDRRLLEKTGGIVQGMSGSPIIQDGRIVGALTHVLVRDPSAGYGIFIGNMLSKMTEPAT